MDLNSETCAVCNTAKSYSEEYDTYYCVQCNEWLEDVCNDRSCTFCNTRPLKPNNDT